MIEILTGQLGETDDGQLFVLKVRSSVCTL